MESGAGFGILIMLIAIFVVAVLLVFAPLMLYGIFSRLGEANDLLRHLAELIAYHAQAGHLARPASADSDRPPTPSPTFRTLG